VWGGGDMGRKGGRGVKVKETQTQGRGEGQRLGVTPGDAITGQRRHRVGDGGGGQRSWVL